MGQLPLAIGLRRGDAIDIEAHAANTEGRSRAEAANRQLQVLRIVVAVLDRESRNDTQALGQIDLQTPRTYRIAIDAIDRRGHVEGIRLGARRSDDHGLAALDLGERERRTERESDQHGVHRCVGHAGSVPERMHRGSSDLPEPGSSPSFGSASRSYPEVILYILAVLA